MVIYSRWEVLAKFNKDMYIDKKKFIKNINLPIFFIVTDFVWSIEQTVILIHVLMQIFYSFTALLTSLCKSNNFTLWYMHTFTSKYNLTLILIYPPACHFSKTLQIALSPTSKKSHVWEDKILLQVSTSNFSNAFLQLNCFSVC